MGIIMNTELKCIKGLLMPVEQVLGYDLERLKRMEKTRRIEMWNNIVSNQQKLEDGFCGDIERDINEQINGKFSMAKLLIATAAYDTKEEIPIIKEFNEKELLLVKELERFAIFEILSIEENVGRLGRREGGLYELITEFYEKGYNNLDTILEDLTILRDLKIALKNRYVTIQKRIQKISIACIERYGLKWLKSSILAKVKESEQIRVEIGRDSQPKVEEFENKLKNYESLGTENQSLIGKKSQLDSTLTRKEIEQIIAGTDIKPPVMESTFKIAYEISREGREGKPVGTAFVIGDAKSVLAQSRQLAPNPMTGLKIEERMITDPEFSSTIKEFAQNDGVYVVTGDGVVEATFRFLMADASRVNIPKGHGTKHTSVAAMTMAAKAAGIVVSQSGGKITIIKDGMFVKSFSP